MTKTFTATALLVCAIPSLLQALDLTPHEINFVSNVPTTVKRYFFLDGSKRVGFHIDSKMLVAGGGSYVNFHFEDLAPSTFKISHSQYTPALPFLDKTLETYRDAARALIDTNATDVQLEEKPNALPINQWKSYQFTFSYNQSGIAYRRSITFLDYHEQEQFVIDVLATARDYEKTYIRSYHVLNSFSDLPSDDTGNGST